ncbi:protein MON2 homolog isoform X1 [Oryza brachyantha]|uniref:protein MON2 homolog isoform X1 n=2 Tax=Oryza brachyantha TaxID=4533 RepID=UPI0007765582|nr:protein MON2 homolog isoform X1 [Oryza brachyantha]
MAFMAALEADLRALSAEARRRHPSVKDAAEHAILKLRSLSSPMEIAQNEDILRMFLVACTVKSVKLSVIGLSCLQKLISHDAVASSALKDILATLRDHAEMTDEIVQLKTLQTILIIFQSHLQPESEANMSQALDICLHLLESNRSSDSVRNTAAATFRQAVALVFDNVVHAESLPSSKASAARLSSRASSVADNVTRSFSQTLSLGRNSAEPIMREKLSNVGKLGLRLLEDLTALAAGGSAMWLRVYSLHRTFALDILEFVLSTYVSVFRALLPYQQVLRHQICSLLMTSLRTNVELEGEAGEPAFRRLVLRLVAHVIRLYSSSLVTESEVFLNMLVKVTRLDLPLWHQILVLEILRGFCIEAHTLRLLFQTFDMNPTNTNVVENIVRALALVVTTIQASDLSEETLAAVAGMFSSKAKGIEWSMDNDASNSAVLVASEAHTITLALEGLLGVVFTIATLTDEALDAGELESPKCELGSRECCGQLALLCAAMVNSSWLTILDSLSLILMRSQGEAIILEILKGYQAFTQACGVLRAIEPLNSFLASLCKFTINNPNEGEKRSIVLSPGSKKVDMLVDQRDSIILTPKNVQALRTLFNVAHRLHNVLGPSWVLVLETLAALDRAIHSPHASTQEVSASVSRLSRDTSGQYSDFHILSSLNSQLFESSALMNIAAVKSLLSALHQLSSQHISGNSQLSGQQIGSVTFSVERMTSILVNNLHRVEPIWDQIAAHHLELASCSNAQLRNMALDSLDHSICSVVGSEKFQGISSTPHHLQEDKLAKESETVSFEYAVLSPLMILYSSNKNIDVQMGALKILLHVLERHGEKLSYSWPSILHMLRAVTDASEKDLISLGFQSIRVIMNEGLATIPVQCLDECILVTGAYGTQKTDINISLTAVGLLWTATDFVVKGLISKSVEKANEAESGGTTKEEIISSSEKDIRQSPLKSVVDYNKLFFSVFSVLQKLGADDRPEVRNSAVRTLFQTLSTHGQKLSKTMWEDCLWIYVFPMLERVSHLASTSSRDEWQGKELGTRAGKAVHMLIHHSRNTAQKQWDETIVLVLGGIARLLRSFFPFLQQLNKFSSGWVLLLDFVKNGILNGSKEVALAAINCLQTFVGSNCSKGNLENSYVRSVLDIYELVLQTSPNYKNDSADKVKQEVLRGLGDLYVQAQSLFNDEMYLRLMTIMHLMIKSSMNPTDNDNESGSIPALQRGILEIIPMLRPTTMLSSMWSPLLLELLCYLNSHDTPLQKQSKEMHEQKSDATNGAAHAFFEQNHLNNSSAKMDNAIGCGWGILFIEKLVPIVVNLFLEAPQNERFNASPEVIQCLGRCMNTRRDNPKGTLWRVSAECFNRVVVDEVTHDSADCRSGLSSYKISRARFWKEVADVYETFLVGSCGRVLSSDVPSVDSVTSDETLEMTVLTIFGDSVLKLQKDAPVEVLQRLVNCLDHCASRTGSLPLQTVGLVPLHCSRFSLSCLQMMFSLCCCTKGPSLCATVSETSKVSSSVLTKRCEIILGQFLTDENDLGARRLPSVRIEETICVLQELARLIINRETANSLSMPLYLKEALEKNGSHGRAHLLALLPTFSELVVSRESRVRELVQVLLRLIASELGLQRLT